MHKRQTLAQFCESSILQIPDALFQMTDVKPMLFDGESSIFYKNLERDLVNVEFHTNTPCIVYVETGNETITTSQNRAIEIRAGEAIFLPTGLNLHSDYVHEGNGLNAYLFFFGPDVLSRFLSTGPMPASTTSHEDAIFKIQGDSVIREYLASLYAIYESLNNPPHLLQHKALELLHLLDLRDDGSLRRGLLAAQRTRKKRNIKRLMDQFALSGISAKELAAQSGRSVSSFNREFKALYGVAPKQWLIDRRMNHARTLMEENHCSVTAAALETGYSNVSHFIAAFKRKYGKTPHRVKQEVSRNPYC